MIINCQISFIIANTFSEKEATFALRPISIFQADSSGEIVVFDQGCCPWKDHLFSIEEEQNITPAIKYVLYTDTAGSWRVQCVPVHLSSFKNRSVAVQ